MKKKLMLLTILLTIPFVKADECPKEIIEEASKVTFEAKPVIGKQIYYELKFSNLTPNLYVEVYEDFTGTTDKYEGTKAKDGVIIINQYFIMDKVNHEAKIYSNNPACGTVLNTIRIHTNKYNTRSESKLCIEHPEYEKCDPFYERTDEDYKQSYEEFEEEFTSEVLNKKTYIQLIFEYIKKYILYFIIPFLAVGIIYSIRIAKKVKERRGKNE